MPLVKYYWWAEYPKSLTNTLTRQQPIWPENTGPVHGDAWAECHSQGVFLAVQPVSVLSGTSAAHHSSLYWMVRVLSFRVFHLTIPEHALIHKHKHTPPWRDWLNVANLHSNTDVSCTGCTKNGEVVSGMSTPITKTQNTKDVSGLGRIQVSVEVFEKKYEN